MGLQINIHSIVGAANLHFANCKSSANSKVPSKSKSKAKAKAKVKSRSQFKVKNDPSNANQRR